MFLIAGREVAVAAAEWRGESEAGWGHIHSVQQNTYKHRSSVVYMVHK